MQAVLLFAIVLSVCLANAQVINYPPWTWDTIGDNVTRHDGPGAGVNPHTISNSHYQILVMFAGWNVSLSQSQAWTEVMAIHFANTYNKALTDVYSVAGPIDALYQSPQEIGVPDLINDLQTRIATYASRGNTLKRIVVLGHSSGTYVAQSMLYLLSNGSDPTGAINGNIDYFCLDGGSFNLTHFIIRTVTRNTFFVYANDTATNTTSPNHALMIKLADRFSNISKVGLIEYDASGSECVKPNHKETSWCVHISLINLVPWDHHTAEAWLDYVYFAPSPHGLTTAYLDVLTDD